MLHGYCQSVYKHRPTDHLALFFCIFGEAVKHVSITSYLTILHSEVMQIGCTCILMVLPWSLTFWYGI